MLQAHSEISNRIFSIQKQEAALIRKCGGESSAGELDAEQYAAQVEALLNARAEMDGKLRAHIYELRAHAKAEHEAEVQLEEIFWNDD
mmetsp:Transcript_1339/g.1561  ORF Transcript_1339/g.1561 Transcript_1339/m.1561 type:complete len:88 (-) Transcript_1339:81-344(-)